MKSDMLFAASDSYAETLASIDGKMKVIKFILLFLICYSCNKNDNNSEPFPCVEEEIITDTISDFMVFEKGKAEFGNANGIKINLPFEAEVSLSIVENTATTNAFDSIFDINFRTFWSYTNGDSPIAELIRLKGIELKEESGCFTLTNNESSSDSIFTDYRVFHGDTKILDYSLDLFDENKLEITSFDLSTRQLQAKLHVSFVADTALLPEFPKNVRFFNVSINHGY